jgi:hypothetical protein
MRESSYSPVKRREEPMIRRQDPDFAKARKIKDATPGPDLVAAAEHKRWLNTLGKADLPAKLHHDQPDVDKALKKAGVDYSTKELSSPSPFAQPPRKQEIVIYTRKGVVVGYSVGATPLNT